MKEALLLLGVAGCVGSTPSKNDTGTPLVPTTTAPARPVPLCLASTPLPYPDGTTSGYEQCADGRIHRVSAEPAPAPGPAGACALTGTGYDCETDADCATGEACRDTTFYTASCGCLPTCATDADCAADEACIGWGAVGTRSDLAYCHPVSCKTDADCASGLCGVSSYDEGCTVAVEIGCRTPVDECRTDAHCPGSTCNMLLESDPPGYWWTCESIFCTFR